MPKRYPQWLDNAVAIDLRSLAERQEITKILREHVPRFIQCGNMIIPDNNKIFPDNNKIFSIEEKLSCKK